MPSRSRSHLPARMQAAARPGRALPLRPPLLTAPGVRRWPASAEQVDAGQKAGAEGNVLDYDRVSKYPRWAKAHPTWLT